MNTYRLHKIGRNGHVVEAVDFEGANDGVAIRKAGDFLGDYDVEIRNGHRVVAYLLREKRNDSHSPQSSVQASPSPSP